MGIRRNSGEESECYKKTEIFHLISGNCQIFPIRGGPQHPKEHAEINFNLQSVEIYCKY